MTSTGMKSDQVRNHLKNLLSKINLYISVNPRADGSMSPKYTSRWKHYSQTRPGFRDPAMENRYLPLLKNPEKKTGCPASKHCTALVGHPNKKHLRKVLIYDQDNF